jgi:tRNA acetyltransferase TAN1
MEQKEKEDQKSDNNNKGEIINKSKDKKEKQNKKNNHDLNSNDELKGFLIFTDKHREKNCIRDAYNILNDVTEKLYPNLIDSNKSEINLNEEINIKNNINTNISSKIEEEIKNLKRNKNIFTSINTRCAATVFIKIEEEYSNLISPKEIVNYIINEVINTKKLLSKCISKFYPVEICMKYNFENFKEKVDELVKKYFDENIENKKTWKIELRIRNNNSVNKKEIMNFIFNKINRDKYIVDYKKPELTFFVEISCNLMCLSVLEKFSEYKYYNIQSLAKTEEEINNERNKLIKLQEEHKNEKEKKEEKNKNEELDNKIEAPNDDEEIDLI